MTRMTYRGIHSTFPMTASMSFKQGYLHIKRERAASPVTTRVLFKPWQTAYFVLRRNPYILEEYKDASLKTQKQIHFIGTVKHVGLVRTSKSQEYAFEIVMQEKTPLLLACENSILRDEWMSAFDQVMRDLDTIKESSSIMQFASPNINARDKYEVRLIDTDLSKRNDLSGMFLMVLNPLRVMLLNSETSVEILSWPISHITFYKETPSQRSIILVMSRHCHFGCGKLMFESKHIENIVKFFDCHFAKSNIDTQSSINASSSFTSSSSMSSASDLSYNVSPKEMRSSTLEINPQSNSPCEQGVFLSSSMYERSVLTENDKLNNLKGGSIVERSADDEEEGDEDTHEYLSNYEGVLQIKHSTEEPYIQPNEPEVNEEWFKNHTNFKRFSNDRIQFRGRCPSDSDEQCQTSYLQLNEDDADLNKKSDEYTQQLLQSVTSCLENPIHNDFQLTNKGMNFKSKSTSYSAPSPKSRVNKDVRRQSEPVKPLKNTTSFEQDIHKFQLQHLQGKSDNVTSAMFKGSPTGTMKFDVVKQTSFPKKKSITLGNQSMEKSFTEFDTRSLSKVGHGLSMTLPGTKISKQSPELDRNLKPKKKSDLISEIVPVMQSETENESQSVLVPPPVPERHSPTQVSERPHKPLRRSDEIDLNDSIPIVEKTAPPLLSSANKVLNPPPLPPKVKLLESTKSVPLTNSFDKESSGTNFRRSFNISPCRESVEKVQVESLLTTANTAEMSSTLHTSTTLSNDDVPPEVPSRDHIPKLLVEQQTLSTSKGDLLSTVDKKQKSTATDTSCSSNVRNVKTMPRAMRQSMPSCLNNLVDYNKASIDTMLHCSVDKNTTPEEQTSIFGVGKHSKKLSMNAGIPSKLLNPRSIAGFPKSPKKFF